MSRSGSADYMTCKSTEQKDKTAKFKEDYMVGKQIGSVHWVLIATILGFLCFSKALRTSTGTEDLRIEDLSENLPDSVQKTIDLA
jgi:hypothetical protein